MKHIGIFAITGYQLLISPLLQVFLGNTFICRYKITCSEYTKEMIRTKGLFSGILLGIKRILSCSPFHR